ncbi:hypothetical protein N0V93_008738 [Gnomoniopsis smithogilvyi]|uniref:Heterokaryon incompatibility domain-containing protein n=1 Tax=Gnomoniopsis smithogilvyi TaxID=1191159 RepID=A0A9W8YPQ0_9PEZI|nr:hypothetical protein N0V93_008738 [Gnomoniopsis smithogilvyi]
MEKFDYKPINLSENTIRILRLHSGKYYDEIKCELIEIPLDQEKIISYDALSYTWGDQPVQEPIVLDKKEALVTRNLDEALRCIRLDDKDKYLWVDALCINQTNDEEKSHQVARMRFIYQSAEETIIWLGPSNPDTVLLMEFATKLNKRGHEKDKYSWPSVWESMEREWNEINIGPGDPRLIGLQNMLNRTWFRRVWIIQEVAMANSAKFRCGQNFIPAKVFAMLPELMGESVDPHVQAVLDVIPGPFRRQSNSWWSRDRKLETLLAKFRSSESSDPRDFVYALLGMTSDFDDGSIISPNYKLSVEDMIQNVVWALLFNEVLDPSKYKLPTWNKEQFLDSLPNLYDTVLQWAISESQLPVLVRFEGCTREVGFRDRLPLHSLIEANPTSDVIEAFLTLANPNINELDKKGRTPLQLAMDQRQVSVVEVLLSHEHIDVNHIDRRGRTPLLSALSFDRFTNAQMLLQHKNVETSHFSGPDLELFREAASSKDFVAFEALRAMYCDANTSHPAGKKRREREALVRASAVGHLPAMRMLLNGRAPTDLRHLASEAPRKKGRYSKCLNVDGLELLLQNGALVDAVDHNGQTALMLAIEFHNPKVVELLLKHGADVNKKTARGTTAMCCGLYSADRSLADLLLKHGADLKCAANAIHNSELWTALKKHNLGLAKRLLDHGVDVDNRNCEGETFLSYIARMGKWDIFQFLLSAGAKLDHVAHNSLVPLLAFSFENNYYCHWQSMGPEATKVDQNIRWNPQAIMALSMCATNVQKKHYEAKTVISTIMTAEFPSILAILQSEDYMRDWKTLDIDLLQRVGRQVSHSRDLKYNSEITLGDFGNQRLLTLQSLLSYNANTEVRDTRGEALLWMAVCRAHRDVVKLFLEHGADVEVADKIYGMSPLWVAALLGFHDIILLLLEKGANMERRCLKAQTPLCVAAEKGCKEAVQVLLAHGADLFAKDGQGRVPLELARENGHQDVVRILSCT